MKIITLKTGKKYEACESWYQKNEGCELMGLNPRDETTANLFEGLHKCSERRFWRYPKNSNQKCEFLKYFLGELDNSKLRRILQKKDKYEYKLYEKFGNRVRFLEHIEESRIPKKILRSLITDNYARGPFEEEYNAEDGIWAVDILVKRKEKKRNY